MTRTDGSRRLLAVALAGAALACNFDTPGFGTDPLGASTGEAATGDDPAGTGSTGVPEPVCGDGQIDPGEQCDYGSGNSDAGLCTGACKLAVCGDGLVSPTEQCDDGNDVDDDGCNNVCGKDTCGDGKLGPGEACDNGAGNSDAGLCTTACEAAVCGDGLVSPLEQCDDGNLADADGCSNTCILKSCGDGDVDAGEECDDGNAVDDDACTTSCKAAACGDGLVQAGEVCDDGNNINDDGCTTACALPACGDGFVQGDEQCDGPTPGVDQCTEDCMALRVDQILLAMSIPIPEYEDPKNPAKPPAEGTTAPDQSACLVFNPPLDPDYPYVHALEFSVAASHGRVGDLVIFLRSPQGTWLIVSNRPGFVEPDGGSNVEGGDNSNMSPQAPLRFRDGGEFSGETLGEGIPTDKAVCLSDGRCDFSPDRGASTKSFASFADFAGAPVGDIGAWSICMQDHVPNTVDGSLHGASLTMVRRKHP